MNWKSLSNCNEVFQISNIFPWSYYNTLIDEFDFKNNTIVWDKRELSEQPLFGQHEDTKWNNNELGWNYKFIHSSRYAEYALKKIIKKNVKLIRINTNFQFYGMESGWHNDYNIPDENAWSLVTYINSKWDYTWDGQFVIRTKNRDYINVNPTPNEGVLFNASLEHRGGAPNRYCTECRMSLAFLFKEVYND
jgi:hypothetical protein